ncbi:oligosaccharide flippase family protein [Dictyobacter arantiisoli]|uniref:Uncharacterized protein n=1 Tax=Dictyobacter arantiisoli TaxID=2014874 RepID=A0A5A5TD46_9CHLR|nr:polysaccharide biosynthesis C-terminal domain-containing protein [Dictyobacter arantiisoli]GCF09450.1 hypothetical protein KDI_30140 [Dictyobacter arantiisoli]
MSLSRDRMRFLWRHRLPAPVQRTTYSVSIDISESENAPDETIPATSLLAPVDPILSGTQSILYMDMVVIAGGGAIASMGYLGSTFIRYVTNVLMAHMVTPAVYGMFGEVYSLMYILGFIAKLGFDIVFIRLLPHYRMQGRLDLISGLTRFILCFTIISGISMAGLFYFFSSQISLWLYHDAAYTALLRETTLLIPLIALQMVLIAGLQAFKQALWKMYVERLAQPLLTLIILIYCFMIGWQVEGLSIATIIGYICSIVLGQVILLRIMRQRTVRIQARYNPRLWMGLTLPMFFSGLVYALADTINTLLLGIVALPAEVAGYLVAERAAIFVTMPMAALAVRYTPLIVEYYCAGSSQKLVHMYRAITHWSFTLSFPIFLWLFVFRQAILVVFGPAYQHYERVLIIMGSGFLVYAILGPASYIFAMLGSPRFIVASSCVSILSNVVLSFVLIQHYGASGAALALVFSSLITYGLSFFWVYYRLKMQPFHHNLYKPLLSGVFAALSGVLASNLIQTESRSLQLPTTILAMLLFVIVYGLALFLLRLSPQDHFVLSHFFTRIITKKRVTHPII